MNITSILSILFALGLVALGITSLIGLFYLTKFSFDPKSTNLPGSKSAFVVEMDKTELQLSQVTVVLAWIQISIPVILALLTLIYSAMNVNMRSARLQMPVVFV